MTEPLKATFFALKHRDRGVLLPATGVFVVIVALLAAAFVALNWDALAHFRDWFLTARDGKDPSRALAVISRVFLLVGSVFLFMIPLYFAFACYEAACLRWMIRGEAPGVFGFIVNNDVWRVYGVYWCWFIAHMAVGMVMSIFMMPIMFLTMGDMMRHPGDAQAMMHWQFSVQLPLTLLQYVPLIFLGVRFGPAAATSIARKRFSFLEAWTVTRRRFWELLGSFALLWVLAGLAWALIFAATIAPMIARAWPLVHDIWQKPSEEHMQAYFSAVLAPGNVAIIGSGYLANMAVALGLAFMSYGVNARAASRALEQGVIALAPGE